MCEKVTCSCCGKIKYKNGKYIRILLNRPHVVQVLFVFIPFWTCALMTHPQNQKGKSNDVNKIWFIHQVISNLKEIGIKEQLTIKPQKVQVPKNDLNTCNMLYKWLSISKSCYFLCKVHHFLFCFSIIVLTMLKMNEFDLIFELGKHFLLWWYIVNIHCMVFKSNKLIQVNLNNYI